MAANMSGMSRAKFVHAMVNNQPEKINKMIDRSILNDGESLEKLRNSEEALSVVLAKIDMEIEKTRVYMVYILHICSYKCVGNAFRTNFEK